MLISVIVITYNSLEFVQQTLNSVSKQTYPELELIISDDCSTDETFSFCKQWAERNKSRFVRIICTQTPHNGGICWNYNHALQQAHGEWIKYIAGDDLLLPDCIETFVAHIEPNCFFYTCSSVHYDAADGNAGQYKGLLPNVNARKQFRLMLRRFYCILGGTLFLEREHLNMLGGFDMRFPFSEDLPISLHYLSKHFRIKTLNEALVVWRCHSKSVSHSDNRFYPSVRSAMKYYTHRYCWRLGMPLMQYYYFVKYWIVENHTKSKWHQMAGYFLRIFDIVNWKRKCWPVGEVVTEEYMGPATEEQKSALC